MTSPDVFDAVLLSLGGYNTVRLNHDDLDALNKLFIAQLKGGYNMYNMRHPTIVSFWGVSISF